MKTIKRKCRCYIEYSWGRSRCGTKTSNKKQVCQPCQSGYCVSVGRKLQKQKKELVMA